MKAEAEKGALLLAERAVGGHRDAQPCDQGVAIGIAAKCGRAPAADQDVALRERTPLSSLTAEAKPDWIAPFGNGLELRQAAKRPFPIVPINARSRQIIVTQPHKGPSAARLKQKFDRRLPRRDAADATPGKNDFAIGHNLDVVTFDLHSAGFRQAKDATRNGIGIDDFGLPFLYLCRIG